MTEDRVTLDGRTIALSSLDKLIFPDAGLTKSDLIDYYRRIAETALPHYRDRPLTMERYPDGIGKDGFFQKDVPDYFPDWIERVRLKKEGGSLDYLLANSAATLVYLANQGCVTPHLGLARADKPDHPDRMIFDLDPSDRDFGKVRRTARRLHALLDDLGLTSFVQTTGSRGLHVVVPLDRSADFDRVRSFARSLSTHLAERYPDELTVEQRKDKRGTRLFLDYLRNAYGQTAVAPYGLRARPEASLATPLHWHEIASSALTPRKYTVANIFRRLAQTGDPWAGIDDRPQGLEQARTRLAERSPSA